MYGQVLGSSTTAVTGAASTATGLAILPNTGGNVLVSLLSLATIALGGVVLASFTYVRVHQLLHR